MSTKWDPFAALRAQQAAAQARNPHRRLTADAPTGITPDRDQGRHSTMPTNEPMNDRIRRAAGVPIRPGHDPAPEVGDYQR